MFIRELLTGDDMNKVTRFSMAIPFLKVALLSAAFMSIRTEIIYPGIRPSVSSFFEQVSGTGYATYLGVSFARA